MAYRNRYWIDQGGGWRDRRNKNRPSSGPKRKVDRRKYRVNPPDTWVSEETIKRRRKKRKAPKQKPPTPVAAGMLLRHSQPRDYKSSFRWFLTSVDEGHPNEVKTCYIILKLTSANYITKRNPKGVRVFAKKWGELPLREARVMTLADLTDEYKYDTTWHPHIRALKGASIKSTPAAGDELRRELAKTKLGRKPKHKKK